MFSSLHIVYALVARLTIIFSLKIALKTFQNWYSLVRSYSKSLNLLFLTEITLSIQCWSAKSKTLLLFFVCPTFKNRIFSISHLPRCRHVWIFQQSSADDNYYILWDTWIAYVKLKGLHFLENTLHFLQFTMRIIAKSGSQK